MALFNRNRFRALASAFMLSAVLTGCGGGGGGGTPGVTQTFTTGTPTAAELTGAGGNDVWTITGDATDGTLTINGVINGVGGTDEFQLNLGAVVASVAYANAAPPAGAVNLHRIEIITLDGGVVNGAIDASGLTGTTGAMFNLASGRVDGDITGSPRDDAFIVSGDITGDSPALALNGLIQGGDGDADEFRLVAGGIVNSITYLDTARENISLQNIEHITIAGGTANGLIDAQSANTGITFNLTSGEANFGVLGSNHADIFNLESGTITGDVNGGDGVDSFVIGAGITIGGMIDGGGAEADTLSLATGFTPVSANLFSDVLVLTLDNGDVLTLALANIATANIDLGGLTISTTAPPALTFTGTAEADIFAITTDITSPGLSPLESVIDGLGGTDVLELNAGAVVASVAFANTAPTGGSGVVNLQNVETITLDGGTVNDQIDASAAPASVGVTVNLMSGNIQGVTVGTNDVVAITGSAGDDTFIITGDLTGDAPALFINGEIRGEGGNMDELQLNAGARVGAITYVRFAQGEGVHLDGIEIITVNGGNIDSIADSELTAELASTGVTFNLFAGTIARTVIGSDNGGDTFNIRGTISIGGFVGGGANAHADTFNLESGTITGSVFGQEGDDVFNLFSAIAIGGFLDGGAGDDTLNYAGAPAGTAFTTARGGLAADDSSITNDTGSVRNIESQADDPAITSLGAGGVGAGGAPAGLRDLTVSGIEVLGLSPALNLYGAMSDALMQFGQQTAQGFALADLNLATGRATSLVSKDSPFTKGRIWAHKITHSGNGKGSIGLGLTGLTARADSDYDYEMSLTQHGFDAPLAITRLGAFNLRAVSHTMTGTIETNVAEANVSGYGAGVALLWNSGAVARQRAKRARAPIISAVSASAHHHHHGLSAHITSLAGAYEVEAHTSPLNPRAVVSEITEGSFSAINAVVSAGVADKREIAYGLSLRTSADITWQTLSLDDFSETGQDGIIINFDKATRFTARVGAGLESEHWFSDVAFVHETSSGGTLSSGLRQDYRQDDGTAIEMKLGGKLADLATGLTLKAYAGLRTSLTRSDAIDPSAHLALNWRF